MQTGEVLFSNLNSISDEHILSGKPSLHTPNSECCHDPWTDLIITVDTQSSFSLTKQLLWKSTALDHNVM